MAPSESIFSSLAGILPVACTVLTYGYRDTDGLSTSRSVWFAGTLNPREIGSFMEAARVSSATSSLFPEPKNTLFIPEQVGIRGLQWEIEREDQAEKPVQHAHHALFTLESFNRPPVGVRQDRAQRTIEDFLVEYLCVDSWDVAYSEIYKSQVDLTNPFAVQAPAADVPVDNDTVNLFEEEEAALPA